VDRAIVFLLCLLPAASLVWAGVTGHLGANPIEAITHATGDWTLRFLLITLAVTPLGRLTGWNPVIRYRRMLGLFAFSYGVLHLLTYVWLDQFFALGDMVRDVAKRPFITVGLLAWLSLVPLAATSTEGMIRRLGSRRWRALHRLIYAAAAFGVVHYWWLVKADVSRPRIYAVILTLLLGYRLVAAYASAPGRRARSRGSRRADEESAA